MEFKDRIKLLRETKGLDLTKLAAQFNMKEAGVRAWELGRTKPGADTIIALAKYFDCTTDYLLGLSNVKSVNVEKQAIGAITGLSGKVIDELELLNNSLIGFDNAMCSLEDFEEQNLTHSPVEILNAIFEHENFFSFILGYSNTAVSFGAVKPLRNSELEKIQKTHKELYEKGVVIVRKYDLLSMKLLEAQNSISNILEDIMINWGKPYRLVKRVMIEDNEDENDNPK